MPDGSGPFDIGDPVTVEAVFKKRIDRGPVHPDDVVATVLKPGGDVFEVEPDPQDPEQPGGPVNTYRVTVDPDEPGDWTVRVAGTGAAKAAEEIVFSVRRRRVPALP